VSNRILILLFGLAGNNSAKPFIAVVLEIFVSRFAFCSEKSSAGWEMRFAVG
jgi:hypothetical protein